MGRQYFSDPLNWEVADGTAIANTTTETIIYPNVTIPAGFMSDGRILDFDVFGKLSTTATPTITFRVRHGGVAGTVLGLTEAITNGSAVAAINWRLHGRIQTRVNGSAGALLLWGTCHVHTAATTVVSNVFGVSGFDAPAQVTVDLTTADWALAISAQWSAASASNTLTGMGRYIGSPN